MISATAAVPVVARTGQAGELAVTIRQRLNGPWGCRVTYTPPQEGRQRVEVGGVGDSPKDAAQAAELTALTAGIPAKYLAQAMSVAVSDAYDLIERAEAKHRLLRLLHAAEGLEGTIAWDGRQASIDMLGWSGLEIDAEATRLAEVWLSGTKPTHHVFAFDPDRDALSFKEQA